VTSVATLDLATWREHERAIDAEQRPDALPLLDRLPASFVASLTELEALALRHDPRAYLRARQLVPDDPSWLVTVLMTGRGWGKSFAAAGYFEQRLLAADAGDYALVAPTIDECWELQWAGPGTIRDQCPPWIRYVERASKNLVIFPDQGIRLRMWSGEKSQYRGPNLRGAWCEEPIKWPNGEELWRNLRLAIRVPGVTPPRAIFTTTPPRELDWILRLCAADDTRVVRGTMRDNPKLDERAVEAAYREMRGTIESERELNGRVVLGVDGALFSPEDLERHRVDAAPDELEAIVVSVDPAQSASSDADPVGIVAAGVKAGHVYVLASSSERLDPSVWAQRAIAWASAHNAGRFVVEPTGSGKYPRDTLRAQLRIMGVASRPIVESKAIGSKADRAQPLSAACAAGRLHVVGRQRQLEKELSTWYPGARWSPNGLDALAHAASVLTQGWRAV